MADSEFTKQEKVDAVKELIRFEGWILYDSRLENLFQSATNKLLASNINNLDENRGFYNCIKLVKELPKRIIDENQK